MGAAVSVGVGVAAALSIGVEVGAVAAVGVGTTVGGEGVAVGAGVDEVQAATDASSNSADSTEMRSLNATQAV